MAASVFASLKVEMAEPTNKFYSFRKAKLIDCNGDLAKRWYIIFYAWDVQLGRLRRKRLYDVNKLKTAAERKAYAKKVIQEINKKLSAGFHFDAQKIREANKKINESENIEYKNAIVALQEVLQINKKIYRVRTYDSFSSIINKFHDFLKSKKWHTLTINRIEQEHAKSFVDSMLKKGHSGKTINGYVGYMKTLFNELLSRGYIEKNPFVGLKKQKEEISHQNLAYSNEQIELIKAELRNTDPQMWQFIQFIYYLYIRPSELRMIRIQDIKLQKATVHIRADISKNRKDAFVSIPENFKEEIRKMELQQYPGSYYLFTSLHQPGLRPLGRNTMGDRYRKHIKRMGINKGYTLYSWKHTGVVRAFLAGVNIKAIQQQCRHHSIYETDKYLRSLGLIENTEIIRHHPAL